MPHLPVPFSIWQCHFWIQQTGGVSFSAERQHLPCGVVFHFRKKDINHEQKSLKPLAEKKFGRIILPAPYKFSVVYRLGS
jgi:hypothetical protein